MARPRSRFVCHSCGAVQAKWMGKCPDCGTWDSLEQDAEHREVAAPPGTAGSIAAWLSEGPSGEHLAPAEATPLDAVAAAEVPRTPTSIDELDRVLGGGLVPGSVVLLGGEPGIGKSTLLLQATTRLAARTAGPVLYVTSEESVEQVKMRADRVLAVDRAGTGAATAATTGGVEALDHRGESMSARARVAPGPSDDAGAAGVAVADETEAAGRRSVDRDDLDVTQAGRNLHLLAETNLARILEQTRRVRPDVCVIDSIQMVYRDDLEAAPGSMAQLRRCCMELVHLAKLSGMAVVVVGHLTKEGALAGPKLLEHLVDVVLSFEGDRHHAHRVVRGIKNRFGSTLEIGLFEMTGSGLAPVAQRGVASADARPRAGSVVTPVMHGSRCLLAEVQGLTATGLLGSARRRASGLDSNRLAMLIAVLEAHGGLRLADQDIYVSAVGGLRLVEPATDLATALAIAGAHLGRALPPGVAVVGEVGLAGEIRPVRQLEQRAAEAARHGFERLLGPPESHSITESPMEIEIVTTVAQALDALQECS